MGNQLRAVSSRYQCGWLPPIALLLSWGLAILAIIWGGVGMNRSDTTGAEDRPKAVMGLVVGLVLLIIGGPVMWFGNLPLVL